jgi:hypothetical protein
MTPELKKAKRRIKAACAKWSGLIPPGFDVIHTYIAASHEDDSNILAVTKCDWEYYQGRIRWYLVCAASQTDAYIEGTLVHELVHVLLWPLWGGSPEDNPLEHKLGEYTTEQIARAILRVSDV